jgi:hypothetical protein
MLTASPHEPLGAPSEEIVVPRYLLYFAIPPAMTTIVLSILDPMLGMTLLGVFFLCGSSCEPPYGATQSEVRVVPSKTQFSSPAGSPGSARIRLARAEPSTPTRRHSRPKTFQGHGSTDQHREKANKPKPPT